jgi:hypothetical protein
MGVSGIAGLTNAEVCGLDEVKVTTSLMAESART